MVETEDTQPVDEKQLSDRVKFIVDKEAFKAVLGYHPMNENISLER